VAKKVIIEVVIDTDDYHLEDKVETILKNFFPVKKIEVRTYNT